MLELAAFALLRLDGRVKPCYFGIVQSKLIESLAFAFWIGVARYRTSFASITIFLLALTSPAQVRITAFSRDGMMAWTNPAAAGLPASPIYRVERSSLPAGPWQTLTSTPQTFFFLTKVKDKEFYAVSDIGTFLRLRLQ